MDLFLIHWPLPTLYDGDFVSTWKTLEEFRADGRARSIGVSNFQVEHLERLAAETDTVPAANQIELHPYLQNREVRSYDEAHGIATEAWSPIAQGEVLDDAVVTEIAQRVGKTPAQAEPTSRAHHQQRHRWSRTGRPSSRTSAAACATEENIVSAQSTRRPGAPRGHNIGRAAAARHLLTLVYDGLRDGNIRCLEATADAA